MIRLYRLTFNKDTGYSVYVNDISQTLFGGAAEGALRPPEGRPGAAIQTPDPDPDPEIAASKAAAGGETRGVDKSPLPFLRFFS
jgi:hypothetical protein